MPADPGGGQRGRELGGDLGPRRRRGLGGAAPGRDAGREGKDERESCQSAGRVDMTRSPRAG